ncbi:hypothetical protein HDV00_011555 [Rhizophlyctis rosea]|nr:hypothetical protein HDV00_011555 [Rhizophlyctis rosea]
MGVWHNYYEDGDELPSVRRFWNVIRGYRQEQLAAQINAPETAAQFRIMLEDEKFSLPEFFSQCFSHKERFSVQEFVFLVHPTVKQFLTITDIIPRVPEYVTPSHHSLKIVKELYENATPYQIKTFEKHVLYWVDTEAS